MLNRFFDKFIFTNQLVFKDYNFFVLNVPFAIVPIDLLLDLASRQNTQMDKTLYYSFKDSTRRRLIPRMALNVDREKFLNFMETFFTASGWGQIMNAEIVESQKHAIVNVSFSPLSRALQGKLGHPCDHFTRGVLAGTFSEYFGVDVEAVETACMGVNAPQCTYVIKPASEFDFSKEETQRQLELKI